MASYKSYFQLFRYGLYLMLYMILRSFQLLYWDAKRGITTKLLLNCSKFGEDVSRLHLLYTTDATSCLHMSRS